jgi:hypothetical protein
MIALLDEQALPYIMKLQNRIALFDFELDQVIGTCQLHLLLTANQRALNYLSWSQCCYSKPLQHFRSPMGSNYCDA